MDSTVRWFGATHLRESTLAPSHAQELCLDAFPVTDSAQAPSSEYDYSRAAARPAGHPEAAGPEKVWRRPLPASAKLFRPKTEIRIPKLRCGSRAPESPVWPFPQASGRPSVRPGQGQQALPGLRGVPEARHRKDCRTGRREARHSSHHTVKPHRDRLAFLACRTGQPASREAHRKPDPLAPPELHRPPALARPQAQERPPAQVPPEECRVPELQRQEELRPQAELRPRAEHRPNRDSPSHKDPTRRANRAPKDPTRRANRVPRDPRPARAPQRPAQ
jgi:hypothetical protein